MVFADAMQARLRDRLRQLAIQVLGRYRVDEMPTVLRPIVRAYGHIGSAGLSAYFSFVHATSTITVENEALGSANQPRIYCHWHEAAFVYPCVYSQMPHLVWMQHPSWYMAPVHGVLERAAVAGIVFGSTGNGGRAAAESLVAAMRGGRSTVILPDGPEGPPHQMRKGVLHIALATGLPIVPMRFELSSFVRLPGWDRKLVPLPFGRIHVVYGAPVHPRAERLDAAIAALSTAMSPPLRN